MLICGFEKFSMVDYPKKIACTLFTYGCNYRCPFCQNAGLVVGASNDLCAVDEKEIFDYLTLRKKFVDAVCISGGEPTLQKDLIDFIIKVKDMGFLVKLDTNGTNPKIIKTLIDRQLVDYFAMDIKNDEKGYGDIIGLSNYDLTAVKESIKLLIDQAPDYEFRTTLVNGYHTRESMLGIAKLIKGTKKYYMQCFKDSGACIESGLSEIDLETAKEYKELMDSLLGKSTGLRNY